MQTIAQLLHQNLLEAKTCQELAQVLNDLTINDQDPSIDNIDFKSIQLLTLVLEKCQHLVFDQESEHDTTPLTESIPGFLNIFEMFFEWIVGTRFFKIKNKTPGLPVPPDRQHLNENELFIFEQMGDKLADVILNCLLPRTRHPYSTSITCCCIWKLLEVDTAEEDDSGDSTFQPPSTTIKMHNHFISVSSYFLQVIIVDQFERFDFDIARLSKNQLLEQLTQCPAMLCHKSDAFRKIAVLNVDFMATLFLMLAEIVCVDYMDDKNSNVALGEDRVAASSLIAGLISMLVDGSRDLTGGLDFSKLIRKFAFVLEKEDPSSLQPFSGVVKPEAREKLLKLIDVVNNGGKFYLNNFKETTNNNNTIGIVEENEEYLGLNEEAMEKLLKKTDKKNDDNGDEISYFTSKTEIIMTRVLRDFSLQLATWEVDLKASEIELRLGVQVALEFGRTTQMSLVCEASPTLRWIVPIISLFNVLLFGTKLVFDSKDRLRDDDTKDAGDTSSDSDGDDENSNNNQQEEKVPISRYIENSWEFLPIFSNALAYDNQRRQFCEADDYSITAMRYIERLINYTLEKTDPFCVNKQEAKDFLASFPNIFAAFGNFCNNLTYNQILGQDLIVETPRLVEKLLCSISRMIELRAEPSDDGEEEDISILPKESKKVLDDFIGYFGVLLYIAHGNESGSDFLKSVGLTPPTKLTPVICPSTGRKIYPPSLKQVLTLTSEMLSSAKNEEKNTSDDTHPRYTQGRYGGKGAVCVTLECCRKKIFPELHEFQYFPEVQSFEEAVAIVDWMTLLNGKYDDFAKYYAFFDLIESFEKGLCERYLKPQKEKYPDKFEAYEKIIDRLKTVMLKSKNKP